MSTALCIASIMSFIFEGSRLTVVTVKSLHY